MLFSYGILWLKFCYIKGLLLDLQLKCIRLFLFVGSLESINFNMGNKQIHKKKYTWHLCVREIVLVIVALAVAQSPRFEGRREIAKSKSKTIMYDVCVICMHGNKNVEIMILILWKFCFCFGREVFGNFEGKFII